MQHGFRVAMRMETVAQLFQLRPNVQMIVDLAVERNRGVAIIAHHGLIAAFEIDDFEANRAKSRHAALVDTLLVGTPMVQRFINPAGQIRSEEHTSELQSL